MIKKKYRILSLLIFLCSINSIAVAKESTVTLEQSIKIAMEKNEEILAAEYGKEVAKWNVLEEKEKEKPSIHYSYTAAQIGGEYWKIYNIKEDPSNYFIHSFTAKYPIYTGGRLESNIKTSTLQELVSTLNLNNIEQQIRYNVTQAYFNILACENFEQTNAQAVEQLTEHLNTVNQQFQTGVVAHVDVLRSEVALANAKQLLVVSEANTKIAKASLKKLLGESEDSELIVNPEEINDSETKYSMENCLAYAKTHRLDYEIAKKNIDIANQQVNIAESENKPDVALTATYETYDTKFDQFATKKWLAGVEVDMNIFDGGVTSSKIKAEKAKVHQKECEAKNVMSTVEFEIQQAYLDMKKAESNIETNKVAVVKAEEDYRLSKMRYEAGLGTNLDVVDANTALTNAHNAYIQSVYDYNVGKAALEKAMGKS